MIKEKLQTLPHKPGCYLMKDIEGTIIYVGKAKDLYNRVRSYFIGSHDAKTTKLVSLIHDFEYIITSSETEAFILEMNLIKKYDPKYNIMLTDDKTYPYICVTDEVYPRILYSRDINKKLGKYYGPYPNAKAAKEIVEMLNKMYPFRKCRILPKRECLYYHIGLCLAPCIKKIHPSQYEEMKVKVHNILKGNAKAEIKSFEILMNEVASKLNYEKAIEYRNLINDLEVISEKQKMAGFQLDTDCFAYYANDEFISIQVFHLRDGNMIERSGFLFDNYGNEEDIFQEFIVKFYQEQNNPLPRLILVSRGNQEALESSLGQIVQIPQKGKKYELIKLVEENAKNRIEVLIKKREYEYQKTGGATNALGELLGIDNLRVIEAFDNSNISGTNAVSAMVVFVDGKPKKNLYRKYKLSSASKGDPQMMYEVIYRRYQNPENNPDLIIVDGGLSQVNSANKALNELNRDLEVIGLIKDDKHRTKSILYNNEIIDVEKNSFEFHLLERIQEEVHRFAVSYFHKTHSKSTFSSQLDNIKGIGKVKKAQILRILGEDNFEEKLKSLKLTETQIQEVLKLLSSN